MNNTPIIYGSIISPYVRKVVITLNIKKIHYTLKPLNPFNPADKKFLLTINPLGKVPVYQENDFVLADSSVICSYLEKTFPECSIFPKNQQDYAKSLWYEEFCDTELFTALNSLFFNTVLAPALNIPINHAAITTALEIKLPNIFEYLNKEIHNKKFIIGDQLSIADISIGQLALINFDFLDIQIDISKWTYLATYINNMAKNPLFNEVFLLAMERLNKIKMKQHNFV